MSVRVAQHLQMAVSTLHKPNASSSLGTHMYVEEPRVIGEREREREREKREERERDKRQAS
jgi:hypothetical protein